MTRIRSIIASSFIAVVSAGEWGQFGPWGPCIEGYMNRTRLCHSWNTKVIHPRKCKTSKLGTHHYETAECMIDYGAAKAEGDVALFSRSAAFLPPLAEIDGTQNNKSDNKSLIDKISLL